MNELHLKIIDMFDNEHLGQNEIAQRLGVTKNLVIGIVYRHCRKKGMIKEYDATAKIIDRLLVLSSLGEEFNAVQDALDWLIDHDHDELWLTRSTRNRMNKRNRER